MCPAPGSPGVSVSVMKHPSSREFFAYWDPKRGEHGRPIGPISSRPRSANCSATSSCCPRQDVGFPFRVAGTRVCALGWVRPQGHELCGVVHRGQPSRDRGDPSLRRRRDARRHRRRHRDSRDGSTAHLELLLLPFNPARTRR